MPTLENQHLFDAAVEHHRSGRLSEAMALYRRIIDRDVNHADALHLLGVVTHQFGNDSERGLELVRRAIAINPSAPEYHCNLGLIFFDRRRWQDAAAAFSRSLSLRPSYAVVHNHLGNTLRELGRLEESAASFRHAVAAKSDFLVAWNNLGNVLRELNRMEESADACRRAIALNPNFAPAHNNLGNALNKQDRLDEAVAEYRRALTLDPHSAETLSNLGNALKDLGRLDEAIATYRDALALDPRLTGCHSNLLYDLHYRAEFDPHAVLEESRAWARQHADPVAAAIRPHTNSRDPNRRLVIGYISPDFRQHSVSAFFLPLLKNHDRRQFEIICYSNVRAPDHMTQAIRQLSGKWRDVVGVPDERVADLIRQDGVDILLDLAGHTAQSRLLVLARRPAPIQMTYLGYPGTTGLAAVDYKLTDMLADPPGLTESHFSETLLRLPRTNWCFAPIVDSATSGWRLKSPPQKPKQDTHQREVRFGSFNNFAKITPAVLDTWALLLQTVPSSRLMLKAKALAMQSVRRDIERRFSDLGISPERLDLRGRLLNPADHLAAYNQIDIALDTFPYHGTTTTCEALWMGVPVVTLAGKTHVSRVGVSLLSNIGLGDLIAETPQQYIEIAAGLAADPPRLSDLRASLHQRMLVSPLTDGAAFAGDVEAQFRIAWERWCSDTSVTPDSGSELTPSPLSTGERESVGRADPTRAGPGDLERFRQIIAQNPDDAEAHFNLGMALHFLGRADEAVACFRRTLELIPDKPEAIANLGSAMQARGEIGEAIALFRKSIELKPSFPEAHYNLALALLLTGHFREGWKEYEHRLDLAGTIRTRLPFRVPRWDGRELDGRTIMIHAEQGYGDTIQFVRYVPEVVGRGGQVLLVVRRELERLLQGDNNQGAEVISRLVVGSRRIDLHIPLMSLPLVLGIDPPLAPPVPYLRRPSQAKWRQVTAQSNGLRIGLVWAGNPEHKGDRLRSMPLAALTPLAGVKATFFSLQVGPATKQAAASPLPLIDLTARLADFADTADLIAELDLVITVDTAIAHLCGALGKETWVLLPFAPDWRWGIDRTDTLWYPSVRLYRQTNAGEWETPVALVASDLRNRIANYPQVR